MLLNASFVSVLTSIGNLLLAFVVLMIMITIHEFGHYSAGRLLRFRINEFSIGMGPKIFSKKKKNGEVFSLRAVPLGGYCAFEGEDEENPSADAFNSQRPWKRLIVLFAGAFFNFVSAVIVCVILFSCYGETVAKVNTVYDYAPGINQQLEKGDIIYKINGKNVFVLDNITRYMTDEMTVTVLKPNGDEVTYEGITRSGFYSFTLSEVPFEVTSTDGKAVLKQGDAVYRLDGVSLHEKNHWNNTLAQAGDTVTLTVMQDEERQFVLTKQQAQALSVTESWYEGIGISVTYSTHRFSFGKALLRVFPYCGEVALLVWRTLGGLFTGAVGLESIGGPITTITMTSQIVSYGLPNILSLIVLMSVNLAVFNLLPVPALDGCRMVFVLIEWIRGKPVNRKVEAYVNGIGFVLLIIFVVLVDLLKL